jgi:sugar phosphate permease
MSNSAFYVCFFFHGMLLGGLHHLLCVTCPADLGTKTKKAGKSSTSAVTGIIDGMGSLGTAIGQFIIGYSVTSLGWKHGYLMIISTITVLTLIPLIDLQRRSTKTNYSTGS